MKSRFWIAMACLLVLASCANKHPVAPLAATPAGPAANSPTGVVQRFQWAWMQRDTAAYVGLPTDDFVFIFAPNDSAGNPYPGHSWDQAVELAAVSHLFAGGGAHPPISDIAMTFDNLLVAQPDPRPGKASRWHQSVRTHVDLKVTWIENDLPTVVSVHGYALFFAVRGDSAMLSPARAAMGGRDSTRWYIQRWEDETAGGIALGAHADPVRNVTWGEIKARHVPSAAPAP